MPGQRAAVGLSLDRSESNNRRRSQPYGLRGRHGLRLGEKSTLRLAAANNRGALEPSGDAIHNYRWRRRHFKRIQYFHVTLQEFFRLSQVGLQTRMRFAEQEGRRIQKFRVVSP